MILPSLSSHYSRIDHQPKGVKLETKHIFGHIWQRVYQFSKALYQLIALIKNKVKPYFANLTMQKFKGIEDASILVVKPAFKQGCQSQYVKNPKKVIDLRLQDLVEFDDTNSALLNSCNIQNQAKNDDDSIDIMNNSYHQAETIDSLLSITNNENIEKQEINYQEPDSKISLIVQQLIEPTQTFLKRISNAPHKTLQDYLNSIKRLHQLSKFMTTYGPKFECISTDKDYQLVQAAMHDIENQTSDLTKKMCNEIRLHYKPNSAIRSDGHCLFWSIKDQLKSKKGVKYYRQLAANFIQHHQQKFKIIINDEMKTQHTMNKIIAYSHSQGGKQIWENKLQQKLGRKPSIVDFYCDCLENDTLWGGISEIKALSAILQIPILVLTRQDSKSWRLDLWLSKFRNKKSPMLLYYNGINHYQSLIPRSTL